MNLRKTGVRGNAPGLPRHDTSMMLPNRTKDDMIPRLIALALVAGLSGPAAAQVSVRYVAPERFTDAENRIGTGLTLRVTLAEMTRILQ